MVGVRPVRVLVQAMGGALVVCLLALLPATAAPTWTTTISDVSIDGKIATEAQVVVAVDGTATAVWTRSNGINYIIQSASRPAGGSWTTPVDLSLPLQNADQPQVAVDGTGRATAVWRRSNGSKDVIQTATRPAGGTWSVPEDLSSSAQDARDPAIAVNPSGKAVAVWSRWNTANWIVQRISRLPGGSWGPTNYDVSGSSVDGSEPDVAINAAGDVAIAWLEPVGAKKVAHARTISATGSSTNATPLSLSAQSAYTPRVAIDNAGNATAIWDLYDQTNDLIQVSTKPPGGSWGPATTISGSGRPGEEPQIATDTAGNLTAVWVMANGMNTVIQSASRPIGAAWTAPVDLSAAGQDAKYPRLAVDPAGNTAAVWQRLDGTYQVVQAATRPAGSAWSAPVSLSVTGQDATYAQVAFDPTGNVTAVWERTTGTGKIIQSRVLDATAPEVSALAAPATGLTGQALSYSITATDTWSNPVAISWGFGDGGKTTGSSVSHTYAAAGTYTIKVTATDAVGNTTTKTATTTITAAPVPTPPTTTPPTVPPVATPPATPAPQITFFTLSKKKISRTRKPRSTKATITLSAAANVTLTFTMKGTKKKTVKKTYALKAGANTIKLSAKKLKLKPGKYVITATASSGAGVSAPATAKLKVTR